MKTKYLNIDWLVPFLGIAVVAGSMVAATAYFKLEGKAQAAEARTAMLDRIYQDQQLSMVLKGIHNGDVKAATQRLDLLLCQSILQTDAESASTDPPTRAYVEDLFRRIALTRPMVGQGAPAGSGQQCTDDQLAAERILTRSLTPTQTVQAK